MWPQFVSLGGFAFTAADLPQFLLQNSYDCSVSIRTLAKSIVYILLKTFICFNHDEIFNDL